MLRLTTLGRLSIEGVETAGGAEVRPRRLALLAILAAAGPNGITREQIAGILWAESEPERARHSLSQELYSLRRDLGNDVISVSTTVRLDPSKITSDVEEFRLAVANARWSAAADAFAGPFLDGFYLADAPDFERWAEEQRTALMHAGLRAIEAAADECGRDGNLQQAVAHWRRLTKLDPLNGRFAIAYANALLAVGDRVGALLHAKAHADLVRHELRMKADAPVAALIDKLRDARPSTPAYVGPRSGSGARFAVRLPTVETAAHRLSRPVLLVVNAGGRSLRIGAMVLVVAVLVAAAWRTFPAWRLRPARSGVHSPVAQRLYDDGLRAFYLFDAVDASRLFNAAVQEDSSWLMPAYYAWRAEVAAGGPRQTELAERVAAIAGSASDGERALVLEHLAASRWDIAALPAAESLAIRFPRDPDVLIRAAEVTPDLARAVALLNRAIAIDSVNASVPTSPCRVCDAFRALVTRYADADSTGRAAETLDRWTGIRPDDYQPWQSRADLFIALARRREAEAALRRADSLGGPRADSAEIALTRHLRLDDVDSANALCSSRLATVGATEFVRYRWLCTIGLRMQGRYRDALLLTHDGRVPDTHITRSGVAPDKTLAAILDMEMGRPRIAALEYAALAGEDRVSILDGSVARNGAWMLTLSGAASAAVGDTVRVRALVDSVELIGQRSLYPRDPLLHHFLRGLLFASAGSHERAVREFRAATSSPTGGYTGINREMGKSLLALGRPAEAIPVLRAALHARLDGSALYVTRTEVHEQLARAFAAAGQSDSAAVHYDIVERSWRSADPFIASRVDSARHWLLRNSRSKR